MYKYIQILLIFLFVTSSLFAQSYVGKQHSFSLDARRMMQVYNGDGDLQKISGYYFKMSFPEALTAIKAKGVNASVEDGKIYVDGKKFRFDTREDGEKTTMIMNLETNKMYHIRWAKKEYMEIDIEEMKKMRQKMQNTMAEQMKGMGAMLENLPPDARKKLEALQMGQMPGSKKSEAKVTPTGKSKTIHGFKTKEYIVNGKNKIEQVWASNEYPELMKLFEEIESPLGEKSDKSEIWSQIKGWPVHQIKVRLNRMQGQGSVDYDEVYSVEKTTHKAGTFSPPAGFKKTTMQEMMKGGFDRF